MLRRNISTRVELGQRITVCCCSVCQRSCFICSDGYSKSFLLISPIYFFSVNLHQPWEENKEELWKCSNTTAATGQRSCKVRGGRRLEPECCKSSVEPVWMSTAVESLLPHLPPGSSRALDQRCNLVAATHYRVGSLWEFDTGAGAQEV